MDIFKDQYEQEIALIKANGNNRPALKIRSEQYQVHERELLDYIKRRSLEQAGRRAAWKYMFKEIMEVKVMDKEDLTSPIDCLTNMKRELEYELKRIQSNQSNQSEEEIEALAQNYNIAIDTLNEANDKL